MIKEIRLLNKLIEDSSKFSQLYQPGIYWKKKNIQTYKEILKKGINKFRGSDNRIGESFSDNQNINILNDYYGGSRGIFKFIFEKIYPFKNIFIRQLSLTSHFKKELNLYKSKYFENNDHINQLSKNFIFEDTTNFGCEDYSMIGEKKISNYYLTIADTHLNFKKNINFNEIKSFFEIGGGFGANIHFILKNYKNIKKIIYLDLPVNLYIGTKYLRYFYGDSISDYLTNYDKEIFFEDNDNLEIICIPPWKISDIKSTFDVFQNSNSFVEMSEDAIKNYALHIEKIMNKKSKIALSSYGNFNSQTTIDPRSLDKYFNIAFELFNYSSMVPGKENIFLISK